MAVGTRFGHGPFSFHVEHWDGRTLRARIETPGYRGQHGFTLRAEAGHVIVTHELDAQLALSRWLLWQLFIARRHDWAVEALFDRMEALLRERPTAEHSERAPPLALRAFVSVRRLIREPRAS
ncbi:MAG: hypothetical protein JWN48_4338 [Myxococcaceae bacterium]|nr:hypothetical protein [Myxococcaceae bacterium]